MITVEQFKKCFPNNRRPQEWTDALNLLLPQWGIDTPEHLVHFLAQCGHESNGFTVLVENLNYTAGALATTWPNRYSAGVVNGKQTPNQLALSLHRQPEAIANNTYANRLGNGNEASGDGWLFRGHGCLQLTGRDLVTAFSRKIGKTVAETLAYLQTIEGALAGSCYFWRDYKNVPAAISSGSVKIITKKVNGGLNGLADRYQRTEQIREALTP